LEDNNAQADNCGNTEDIKHNAQEVPKELVERISFTSDEISVRRKALADLFFRIHHTKMFIHGKPGPKSYTFINMF